MVTALFRAYPDFFRFWLSQAISQVGDRVHSLALIWLVYHWSGSALAVGMILIATSLPGILISPLAGVLCDRFSRRRIMIIADLARSVVVGWLAWQAHTGHLGYTGLIAATVAIALASAFFNPAALAMIPGLVRREALTRANAASQLVAGLSAVVGPLFGSALIALIGVSLAFALNAASFLGSALFIALVHEPETARTAGTGFLDELRAGREAMRRAPLIGALMGPVVVVNFFFAAIPVVTPVLAESVYRSGAAGLGILMSCFGGGLFAGSLLLSLGGQRRERTMALAGFALMGCGFLGIALSPWLAAAGAGLLCVGCGLSVVNITLITLFQKLLDDATRGKIMALISALALSLQPIAYGVMGLITDVLAPSGALLAGGAVILLVTLRMAALKTLKEV
ncbi:MAG: MFS transporter [Deltaproteobacteria bacterium]|nr:MFS transporter [Deltaproteobacteria bacterium]